MPKMSIEKAHALPPEEVRKRLDALSQTLSDKYGIVSEWKSETEAVFKRTGASGSIHCLADKVVVNVDLSFALTPMKSQVEGRIRHELEKALADQGG